MPISVIQRTRAIRFLSILKFHLRQRRAAALLSIRPEGYHNGATAASHLLSIVEESRAEAARDNFPPLKFLSR
jgi:hypothetical protein